MQILDSLIDGPLALTSEREGDELIGKIVRYLRTGKEPVAKGNAQALLIGIWPVLQTSRARIVAGSKGGSNEESKPASKQPSKTGSKQASKQPNKRPSEEEEEVGVRNKELGTRNEELKSGRRFRAPTEDEVRAYAEERGLVIDASRFCDFYSSKGWKVGSSAMKDWQAAARNWARRDRKEACCGEASEYAQAF